MIVKMECKSCGAPLEVDDSKSFFFCQHCGAKQVVVADQIIENRNFNYNFNKNIKDENVFIEFTSRRDDLILSVRVSDSGWEDAFEPNQCTEIILSEGWHEVWFNCNGVVQRRDIYIREDNAQVRISVSYTSEWIIAINQPPIPQEALQRKDAEIIRGDKIKKIKYFDRDRVNKVGVVATVFAAVGFIFALCGVAGAAIPLIVIAAILGLISIENIVRKCRGWGASIAAYILIGITILLLIIPAVISSYIMKQVNYENTGAISIENYSDVQQASFDQIEEMTGIKFAEYEK